MVGAGTCSITASQAGSDNYNAATDVTQTFGVAKADQSIDFTDPSDTTFAPAGTVGPHGDRILWSRCELRQQRCDCLHGVWFDGHDGRCGHLQHREPGGQR